MIPHKCRVKHDPPNSYGDCLRASVASILSVPFVEDVPHFAYDGNSDENLPRLRAYLAEKHLTCAIMAFPDDVSHEMIMQYMHFANPGFNYLLFGATDTADHVVICRDGEIIHDTSWFPQPLTNAGSSGMWHVIVFIDSRVI